MKAFSHKVFIPALAIVALMAFPLATSSRVIAQAATQQFKVGDRVEVDTMWSQHPETSTSWRKGTVVNFYWPEDHFGGLLIKMDEDGREFWHRFVDKQWIRAAQRADAPAANNNQTGNPAAANQTTPDANQTGAVSCPASADLKATPQVAAFKC